MMKVNNQNQNVTAGTIFTIFKKITDCIRPSLLNRLDRGTDLLSECCRGVLLSSCFLVLENVRH